MRLLATLVALLAAISLHFRDAQTDTDKNIFVYNNGYLPNVSAYLTLLEELRSRLAGGTVHRIAVTRPPTNVPVQERFIQVQLENNSGEVITVIIDTVNVYVVGYLGGGSTLRPTLHYLNDIPREALFQAFPSPQYAHSSLGFAGNYGSLPPRDEVELGHGALNDAIRSLYYGQSQPRALLVIIQMVPEAVRIRYIQRVVRQSMIAERGEGVNFIPDARAISMENRWSDLSEQIQWSGESGIFLRTIQVQSELGGVIPITSVAVSLIEAILDLMLYRCDPRAIRMPVPAVGDGQCPFGEPTINIIGRDEQCMDVRDGQYHDGNAIILWECGKVQPNQLWTFKSDGTIRCNGKCLTTYGYAPGDYIMIYDCDTAVPEATQWLFLTVGSIVNPKSGLVISAEASTQGTVLMVAEDNNSSSQAWSAGNFTQPTVNYISGLDDMCLQANGAEERVSLANCVIRTEGRQMWAIYGDSTIRPYTDRTLCVTSAGHSSSAHIILRKCQGWGDQRWTFMVDGTILNPNARLVMDALSHQNIILNEPAGNPSQNWFVF